MLKPGMIVTGKVVAIKPYGALVELTGDRMSILHISKISEKFVANIEEYVKVGEWIRAEILTYGDERVEISIKNLRNYRMNQQDAQAFEPLAQRLPTWISQTLTKLQ